MSAFEEYSMYMDNKDFLISQNIITFSGMDGRLMALRPDVTLSVVKNTKADFGHTEKLFYNEKVYRLERGSKTFKEVSQIGVEVLGDVDKATEAEVAAHFKNAFRRRGKERARLVAYGVRQRAFGKFFRRGGGKTRAVCLS